MAVVFLGKLHRLLDSWSCLSAEIKVLEKIFIQLYMFIHSLMKIYYFILIRECNSLVSWVENVEIKRMSIIFALDKKLGLVW